ncbi:MAG TPA: hypothetical protein VEF92_06920 [Burkholderiales bacterium]|nr:hypothetical protein [Burkholderiales bacterium]HYA47269.1 hypothetical protein [Burkholderiales bacterium]
MRIAALACAALIPAASLAAVTYSFDWYCSGCARLGMGTNGREGPFGSGSACEGMRSTLSGSLASRGCGAGRCFNPQPCVASGQPDLLAPPAVSVPRTAVPETAKVPAYVDARPDRVRRADGVRPQKEGPEAISGRWRNSFSWYDVRVSNEAIQIALVETCRTPDCLRREYPNRAVFLGRLEGNRLVGVVPIRSAIESEQNGRHCGTLAGEFPVEGRLSDDHGTIVWRNAQLPAAEGCAPVSISLGTWRRG